MEQFLNTNNVNNALDILKSNSDINNKFNLFLKEYGHRCAEELNFSVPRWREDPAFIIDVLKNYLNSNSKNPHEKIEELKMQQLKLLEDLNQKWPKWKFYIFKKALKRAQIALKAREDFKSEAVKHIALLRMSVLRIGENLIQRGLLKDSSDIFFFNLAEINNLESDENYDKDFFKKIEERKIQLKKYEDMELPGIIDDPDHISIEQKVDKKLDAFPLKGIAASYGKAEGIARVILDIKDIGRLQPGEILVTDHTDPADPGWTPIFATVKGVITNRGGLLSHACIVAREYGLPAIVNVPNATEIIKDGQYLILDGNEGTINISLEASKK